MSFRERMHPRHSGIEEDFSIWLQQHGYNYKTGQKYPLKLPEGNPFYPEHQFLITEPDHTLPELNAEVYLDGPPHKKRREKDRFIRKLLEKQYGKTVKSYDYERNTPKTRRLLFPQIGRDLEKIKAFLEAQNGYYLQTI